MRRRALLFFMIAGVALVMSATALAANIPFYAIAYPIPYSGRVWIDGQEKPTDPNVSDCLAYLYFASDAIQGVPGSPTNLFSNVDPLGTLGVFSLYDANEDSVTSATGGWKDALLTIFSLSVEGMNALYSYPDEVNVLWTPEANNPPYFYWGGTFLTYSYNVTATFPTSAIPDAGGYGNGGASGIDGAVDPSHVSGEFKGTFQPTCCGGSENAPEYDFDFKFDYEVPPGGEYAFGTVVPEPSAVILLGTGLLGIALAARRRRK